MVLCLSMPALAQRNVAIQQTKGYELTLVDPSSYTYSFTNKTNKPIDFINFRFEYTDAAGVVRSFNSAFSSFGLGGNSLAPGASLVVTPTSAKLGAKGPNGHFLSKKADGTKATEIDQLNTLSNVRLSVDLAIAGNQKIGADKSKNVARLKDQNARIVTIYQRTQANHGSKPSISDLTADEQGKMQLLMGAFFDKNNAQRGSVLTRAYQNTQRFPKGL